MEFNSWFDVAIKLNPANQPHLFCIYVHEILAYMFGL